MNLKPIEELLWHTYQEAEYPALKEQMIRWAKECPLVGMQLLDATPVYRNTLLKYLALIAAGAQLTVGISRVMAYVRASSVCWRNVAFRFVMQINVMLMSLSISFSIVPVPFPI